MSGRNQHVEQGKKLAELVIKQAQTRQRASQKVEKRKGSGVAVLPGKLTDCESRDIAFRAAIEMLAREMSAELIAIREAARVMDIRLNGATAAVVGATGAVGSDRSTT